MKVLRTIGIGSFILLALASMGFSQKWQPLNKQPNFSVGAVALLTDGTVLLHQEQNGNPALWFKLTPDNTGSYVNGTITPIATLPVINGTQYAPFFFSSAVLTDGRYLIEGGEYNQGQSVWTNMGAIYDPAANKWTAVKPPSGWNSIGDSQSAILANGTYMQADCCEGVNQSLFNQKTLTWTSITNTGKKDRFDEEGWALLPNGNVLTTDAINAPNSEIYNPTTKKWTSGGSTINRLEDPNSQEIGPMVLRPDGTVFATGASPAGTTGLTAIFNSKTSTWAKGPNLPTGTACDDAPAALEINGKVIVMSSPPVFNPGGVFSEWDGKTLTKISGPPNGSTDPAYVGHFLVLPSGQLLFTDFSSDVEIFTSKGAALKAWRPTITSVPSTITHGNTYVVKGTKFNGFSQGAAYGDDFQDATNFALVRITNTATKHVFYAKTHNPSTMAVATGKKAVSTSFDVPAGIETGASSLVVVANGIPSAAQAVTVN
jgi:hypothetical protein